MRRSRRRLLIGLLVLLLGPLILLVEVLIALRVERIEPYARTELDGRLGPSQGEPLRVVWIGDSTGAGVGAERVDSALPRLVAASLGRPVQLSVLAVSGARVADAVRDQLPELASLQPDWVFIGIGNNDVTHLTRSGSVRDALDTLVAGATATEAEQVVVLGTAAFAGTPLLRQPLRALAAWRSRRLDAIVRAIADAHGARYVPIAADTGPAFEADPQGLHASDGFHPNDAGYALWAESVLRAIGTDLPGR